MNNWNEILPILVPIVLNLGMAIYFVGNWNSQLTGFSTRLDRIEKESERNQDTSNRADARVDERIQALALVIARLEPQINDIRSHLSFMSRQAQDCTVPDCPLAVNLGRRLMKPQNA